MSTPIESHTLQKRDAPHFPQSNHLKRGLQAYQSERMSQTYTDLKEHSEYHRIGKFFFDEIYGPKDFTFRDTSIRKLHQAMEGRIDGNILSAVDMVFDLQELSEELDDRLVERMVARGFGPELTAIQYKTIYRDLDNFDQRMTQVEMANDAVLEFHRFSKKWLVGVSLKTARSAARIMELVDPLWISFTRAMWPSTASTISNFLPTLFTAGKRPSIGLFGRNKLFTL